jgi:hypothetical protein
MKLAIFSAVLLGCLVSFFSTPAQAQRDYFTDEEIELIRDTQAIDARIDVLTHAIDRRFSVLSVNTADPAVRRKDADKWGPLPTGSRLELLSDVKYILQKAIDDIDNLAENPKAAHIPFEDEKKPKDATALFPKAVRKLADAAGRYEPALKSQLEISKDPQEKGVIQDSIELCDEIIASVTKLSAEPSKKSGKDH